VNAVSHPLATIEGLIGDAIQQLELIADEMTQAEKWASGEKRAIRAELRELVRDILALEKVAALEARLFDLEKQREADGDIVPPQSMTTTLPEASA
jgi:hypothetical protein